ncbi:unnamed protein product [Vitrella brassicaformis CCMP3155]|uniref:SET domain-containing protein n=1 Tax=Vitrella brassicaformis (strain CCMP3155) TaxID=1169540 RepID=A0A0G4GZW5_VITBC|nr:unnamed protein product [Vitrella brassicaformis CCMP3155]|eukprot:CEM36629.1 unnamed protein product [Vitrella brassicaformis CCMP3155]
MAQQRQFKEGELLDKGLYRSLTPKQKGQFLLQRWDQEFEALKDHNKVFRSIQEWLGLDEPVDVKGKPLLEFEPGTVFPYRNAMLLFGVHKQMVAGIAFRDGICTSVVSNGGYKDDWDRGSRVVYAGEGKAEEDDQTLSRGNDALLSAYAKGEKIRFVRGYKALSQYAPPWGFRYDGLFTVRNAYVDTTVERGARRRVWKFVLQSTQMADYVLLRAPRANEVQSCLPPAGTEKRALADRNSSDFIKEQRKMLNREPTRAIPLLFPTPDHDAAADATTRIAHQTLRLTTLELVLLDQHNAMKQQIEKVLSGYVKENDETFRQEHGDESLDRLVEYIDASQGWFEGEAFGAHDFFPYLLVVQYKDKDDNVQMTEILPIPRTLESDVACTMFPQLQERDDNISMSILCQLPLPDWDPMLDIAQRRESCDVPVVSTDGYGVGAVLNNLPSYMPYQLQLHKPPVMNPPLPHICAGCVPPDKRAIAEKEKYWDEESGEWAWKDEDGTVCSAGLNTDKLWPGAVAYCSESSPCKTANVDHVCSNWSPAWLGQLGVPVCISHSDKLGWGLVAQSAIGAGDFVGEFAGEVITLGEWRARVLKYENDPTGGKYQYAISVLPFDQLPKGADALAPAVDAMYFGNAMRYANHSCEPNMERKVIFCGDPSKGCIPQIGFFAIRDIEEGEPLTYDYMSDGFGRAKGLQCFCGSSKCTGTIGGDPPTRDRRVHGSPAAAAAATAASASASASASGQDGTQDQPGSSKGKDGKPAPAPPANKKKPGKRKRQGGDGDGPYIHDWAPLIAEREGGFPDDVLAATRGSGRGPWDSDPRPWQQFTLVDEKDEAHRRKKARRVSGGGAARIWMHG